MMTVVMTSEAARQLGVRPEVLRHTLETHKLRDTMERTPAGDRVFFPADIARLRRELDALEGGDFLRVRERVAVAKRLAKKTGRGFTDCWRELLAALGDPVRDAEPRAYGGSGVTGDPH